MDERAPIDGGPVAEPSWRARWYPRAILAAMVVAFVVVVAAGSGSDAVSGRLGGDFPAFYAAGRLVLDDPDALYEPARQTAAQVDLFGGETDGFLYFAYPPYVAAPYVALAELPYRLAYVVHTLVMGALVVAALALVRPLVPFVARRFEVSVVAALAFYPLFAGVTLGQNTALVLVLVAGAFRLLHDEHDVAAGLVLAGMLFKPQYAVPLVGCAVLARRWRVLVGVAVMTAALYLVGVAVQGWGWVGPWIEQVRWFTEIDAEVNAGNAISWLGMAESVWGVGSGPALVVGWGLAGVTALALAWCWWRGADPARLPWLLALALPAMILIAPHAMFYDAGVLVLALGVLASRHPTPWWGLGALYAVAFTQLFADALPLSPLGPVTVAVLVWVVLEVRRAGVLATGGPSTPRPAARMGS